MCAGRRESSWPSPSESTDPALGRSRRQPPASLPTGPPMRRGLGAAPTPRLPSSESELGWAIDDFQRGLRRSGPYRPDGLETAETRSQHIERLRSELLEGKR